MSIVKDKLFLLNYLIRLSGRTANKLPDITQCRRRITPLVIRKNSRQQTDKKSNKFELIFSFSIMDMSSLLRLSILSITEFILSMQKSTTAGSTR